MAGHRDDGTFAEDRAHHPARKVGKCRDCEDVGHTDAAGRCSACADWKKVLQSEAWNGPDREDYNDWNEGLY